MDDVVVQYETPIAGIGHAVAPRSDGSHEPHYDRHDACGRKRTDPLPPGLSPGQVVNWTIADIKANWRAMRRDSYEGPDMSIDPLAIKTNWIEPPDDPEQNERVRRNLDMAQVFIAKLFEDPALLETIPYGAHLIFIPDDPEVAAENRAAGEAMQAAGHVVHFVRVP